MGPMGDTVPWAPRAPMVLMMLRISRVQLMHMERGRERETCQEDPGEAQLNKNIPNRRLISC